MHIIDFVKSKCTKVQNKKKNFKLQRRNPKRKFYKRKIRNDLYYRG